MRHLFVPACVCLVTWTGATASDQNYPREEFSGISVVEKRATAALQAGSGADDNAASANVEAVKPAEVVKSVAIAEAAKPAAAAEDAKPAAAVEVIASVVTPVSNAPIEIPAQENLDQALEPEAKPAPIPLPPVAKPVVHRSRQEVCDSVTQAAGRNNLPLPFFIRLLFQESGFKPGVVSAAGAEGVAQFMPGTSAQMGLDNPFDPLQAIPAAARLLRNLFDQFGNLGLAAAAYNAGPGRIQSWMNKNSKLPEETQGYVKIITGRAAETWKTAAAAGSPEMRLPRRAPCQEEAGLYAWNGPERIPLPPRSRNGATVTARADSKPAVAAVKVAQKSVAVAKHSTKMAKTIKVAVVKQPGAVQIASRKQDGVIQIAVPEPVGSIQIAARKKVGAKKMDSKTAKLAAKNAPIKYAMATRGAHK
jgi:soluble lytic murein transglycosylase-like protein